LDFRRQLRRTVIIYDTRVDSRMWLLKIAHILLLVLSFYKVESCQPELVEDAADLVSVGYDRLRTTALYVDTIEVKMRNKRQKFSNLLTPNCNSRRDVKQVKLAIRKHGSQDWDELEKEIKISSKHNDDLKNIDPCQIYEVRVSIVPKGDGESRVLPIFTVGPYFELDNEDIAIAKFKRDGESYFKEHFKTEVTKVTDNSFTMTWNEICAKRINIWVRDVDLVEENGIEKSIKNDIRNPTTEVTFDVQHCKNYEVVFEFFLDSEDVDEQGYEYELEKQVTTDPNTNELKKRFMKNTYNNNSKVLNWDYSALIDEFDCLDSFSYKLVKDENGDTEVLKEGSHEESTQEEFNVGTLKSDCNFGVRTEIEYKTVQGHVDSVDGFEIHIQQPDQRDNSITVNGTNIFFEVNPCVAEHAEDVVIGLAEVEGKERSIHGRMLESGITAQVPVDKSMSDIKRSAFDENDMKSCVAYKIMLLRRSNNDFKELETADFENPKWSTWKAPTLLGSGHETSITFNLTDNETGGECSVRHYNISCTEEGGKNTKEKMFNPNEKLVMEDLSEETKYNCTGRIVHTIPGAGDSNTFDTPFSNFIEIKTMTPVPEPTLPPKPESTTAEDPKAKPEVLAPKSAGQKSGGFLSCLFYFGFLFVFRGSLAMI